MVNGFMVVVATAFYLAPPVLAVFIDRQAAAFQKQAFGHLRKAARNLRIMAWAIFVYYIGVLVGSALIGDLAYMYQWPVRAEGVQIYVRIGATIVGYVFALFVTRELYVATLPGQGQKRGA